MPGMLGVKPPLSKCGYARRVGMQPKMVHEALYAPRRLRAPMLKGLPVGERTPGRRVIPSDTTLGWLANSLEIAPSVLTRAANELRESETKPKQLPTRVAKLLRREGRKGLRERGDRLRARRLKRL